MGVDWMADGVDGWDGWMDRWMAPLLLSDLNPLSLHASIYRDGRWARTAGTLLLATLSLQPCSRKYETGPHIYIRKYLL